MNDLKFYNSLTKRLETFLPIEPGKVKIYNCGPTVYKRQHLGNMRRFLFSDILRRSLEFVGYEVRDITNITDVGHLTQDDLDEGEDKLEKAAREEKITPQAIADTQIRLFQSDIAALNIEPAHLYPRASQHITQMIELIKLLIDKKHAYIASSGVYYDVTSFAAYGELSGNKLADLEAGKRLAVREEKKNPADFALWLFDTKQIQRWPSPWGEGYPGWHIECSAMSLEYLGSELDIHTGGEDNKFPHHENEIAQSEGATGKPLARIWMHNAHLQLDGQKMAKREGEVFSIDTLKEKGFSPLAFRLFVFSAHYRHKINFTWEAMTEAQKNLDAVKNLLRRLPSSNDSEKAKASTEPLIAFQAALADDLNTPQALAVFLEYIRQANISLDASVLPTLHQFDRVLGIIASLQKELANEEVLPEEIQKIAAERQEARVQKDFAKSDALRLRLSDLGYALEDTSEGQRVYKK